MQKKKYKANVRPVKVEPVAAVKPEAEVAVEVKAEEVAVAEEAVVEVKAEEVAVAEEAVVEVKAEETETVVEAVAESKPIEKKGRKAKKAAAKPVKEPVKPEVLVQYQNNEIDVADIEARIKAQFIAEGHKVGFIKKFSIYVKPEEYSAYYAINDKFYGRVDLF